MTMDDNVMHRSVVSREHQYFKQAFVVSEDCKETG